MAQTQSTNEQVLEQVQHENDEAQQFDIGFEIYFVINTILTFCRRNSDKIVQN